MTATVVLVHGAFADSSSWNGEIERLRAAGHRVIAAANPLRGVAEDAAYVRSLLDSIEGPIVLAGHSYGGSVISAAAKGHRRVQALVYIAGFLPDEGESAGELAGKFPGGTLGETLEQVALPNGVDLYVRQDLFHQQFAADVPAAQASQMAAGQRPIAAAALDEASPAPAWKDLPVYSLIPTADKNIPAAAQRFMAERANAEAVEVEGASHAVLVSQPEAVANLILRAAR
ncbi:MULTISPECIES: alpha/beta fold hydrolase [Amycolatopsis]|uniref:Alpha/beta hydrolase n=1 Tax=Amycolatopsis dendrobii TaxID=2760662 RepID=A0A7W3VYM4_9PSEU|nr:MULTISPECIES: alpha/beta hydrolase [Amycolatopsis]MBB1155491.1 alpha/beta hydrolase [Amycolatopsis dendrobii]UKD54573.1 alpha/beta hydrolase [Amycolatopsis sp. FU40]